jgi:hypothetical protein
MEKTEINHCTVLAHVWNKKFSTELNLYVGEKIMGQMHYHRDSDNVAEAIIGNHIWIVERIGNGYESSLITVKNVTQLNPYFKICIDLKGTSTPLELNDGRTVKFQNTCFWKNSWAWVDVDTNEELIDFNMKAATNKVGISSLAPTFINDKEIPLLCMLGWFILHSFDINEKMNLELVDAQNF